MTGAQIDDAEPAHAESAAAVEVITFVVRSAVEYAAAHRPHIGQLRLTFPQNEPGDSAHKWWIAMPQRQELAFILTDPGRSGTTALACYNVLKPSSGAMNQLTHEHLTHDDPATGPSDRSFGWVFAVFFSLVGIWPLLHRAPVRWWAVSISGTFALLTLIRPSLLHPANRMWTRFGLLLSRITNPVFTGLLYFLVITPIGLLMRLSGKDLLRLRRDLNATTYWIQRRPPGPKPESMPQQF